MNRSLTFTPTGAAGSVLVTDLLGYRMVGGELMARIVTSRGQEVYAYLDELTIWSL